MAVTLLPDPDSPTIPSTWPRSSSKLTPSTARTIPSSVANWTFRSLTSTRRSATSGPRMGSVGPLGRSDSRIEVGVDEVDDHAEEDDEERRVDRHAHDRREIEILHGLRRVPAHALQVEDRLGEDRAPSEHGGEVEAEERHDRDQRVA